MGRSHVDKYGPTPLVPLGLEIRHIRIWYALYSLKRPFFVWPSSLRIEMASCRFNRFQRIQLIFNQVSLMYYDTSAHKVK